MNIWALIELALFAAQTALAVARKNPGTPEEVIRTLEGTVAEIQKVYGSPVMKAQLEGLRTEKLWPDVPAGP